MQVSARSAVSTGEEGLIADDGDIEERGVEGEERELPFLCECGDVGCELCAPMTAREYDELPIYPPGLALAPEHDDEG